MNKETIISEVSSKLSEMGITCIKEQRTDLAISCEFIDAGWSTGQKKINYEAAPFILTRIVGLFLCGK